MKDQCACRTLCNQDRGRRSLTVWLFCGALHAIVFGAGYLAWLASRVKMMLFLLYIKSIYCASTSEICNLLILNGYQIISSRWTPTWVTIFVSMHNIFQQSTSAYVSLLENHIPFALSFVSSLSLVFPVLAGFSSNVSPTMTSFEERGRSARISSIPGRDEE